MNTGQAFLANVAFPFHFGSGCLRALDRPGSTEVFTCRVSITGLRGGLLCIDLQNPYQHPNIIGVRRYCIRHFDNSLPTPRIGFLSQVKMVADALIYHPVVSHYNRFVATTGTHKYRTLPLQGI